MVYICRWSLPCYQVFYYNCLCKLLYLMFEYYNYVWRTCRYRMAYDCPISTPTRKNQWDIGDDVVCTGVPNTHRPIGHPSKRIMKKFLEINNKKTKDVHKYCHCAFGATIRQHVWILLVSQIHSYLKLSNQMLSPSQHSWGMDLGRNY